MPMQESVRLSIGVQILSHVLGNGHSDTPSAYIPYEYLEAENPKGKRKERKEEKRI